MRKPRRAARISYSASVAVGLVDSVVVDLVVADLVVAALLLVDSAVGVALHLVVVEAVQADSVVVVVVDRVDSEVADSVDGPEEVQSVAEEARVDLAGAAEAVMVAVAMAGIEAAADEETNA